MTESATLTDRVAAQIRREGPMRFDRVIELALYDPVAGFFTSSGGAGRGGGDFLTSPEVGPLFGAVVARAFDAWWHELDEPDPFTVVETGAGRAMLARSVLAVQPECRPALRYVAVERADRPRAEHPDLPGLESQSELQAEPFVGVVLANELLDNLPFRLFERGADVWYEVGTGLDHEGLLAEVLLPVDEADGRRAGALVPNARPGDRIPIQDQAVAWLHDALTLVERGRVVVIDYARDTADLAARPIDEWVRTYRAHGRGVGFLRALGEQDITVDVAIDQLALVQPPWADRSQAEFLASHGLDDLVDEGRRLWHERGHLGDLEAVKGRSRVTEAEALTDPSGLGGFRVLEWLCW